MATIFSIVTLTILTFADEQSEPISLDRDGPRFGFTIYTGDMVKTEFTNRLDGKEYTPFTAIFGWQFEKILISKDNNGQSVGVMFQASPLIAG